MTDQPSVTLRQLQQETARWTYKPGYRLTVEADYLGSGTPALVITARVTDTYRPGAGHPPIVLRFTRPLPGGLWHRGTIEEFRDFLRITIGDYELHERDEWLLQDGQRVYDPHADREPYRPVANHGPGRR